MEFSAESTRITYPTSPKHRHTCGDPVSLFCETSGKETLTWNGSQFSEWKEPMDEYFEERLRKYFTPAELVEFLNISMDVIFDKLADRIMDNYQDLVDEICFDLTSGEEDERD
jgi:hypothetical protein